MGWVREMREIERGGSGGREISERNSERTRERWEGSGERDGEGERDRERARERRKTQRRTFSSIYKAKRLVATGGGDGSRCCVEGSPEPSRCFFLIRHCEINSKKVLKMSVSYKYWDDCVDLEDMQLMWNDVEVSKEWTDAGERSGHKVHLSRDPDGQTYLTQTEMRAVAGIIVERHFKSQLDPDMLCALAEVLSDRQLTAKNYDKKQKETRIGIMQISPATAEWIVRELGYRNYNLEDSSLLYQPFVNVYFGAAYVKWLSSHDGKQRSEEYVVRAYKGGIKKATHKSTMRHFERYFSVKRSLPLKRRQEKYDFHNLTTDILSIDASAEVKPGDEWTYWDSRVSKKDMDELWKNPEVLREWIKSGEEPGKVRFSQDSEKRPYLSRVEVKAVAEIIISQYFSERTMQPAALAALAELCSLRFLNGLRSHTGLMGIDYPTAFWMYRDLGFRAYEVNSVEDLYNPFVSVYFAAAYCTWLLEYEGRERSHEFVVQAYLGGPENVNLQETGPLWKKFQEALRYYHDPKKEERSCCIL